jgi:hypothetical protein
MRFTVSRLARHGRRISFTVRITAGKGTVGGVAQSGRRSVRLRAVREDSRVLLSASLAPGRWQLSVSGSPATGYSAPKPVRMTFTIR